jgi:hypothetical protein
MQHSLGVQLWTCSSICLHTDNRRRDCYRHSCWWNDPFEVQQTVFQAASDARRCSAVDPAFEEASLGDKCPIDLERLDQTRPKPITLAALGRTLAE